jgi:hypothetical protein
MLIALASVWVVCLVVASFMPARDKRKLGTLASEHEPPSHTTLIHRLGHMSGFGVAALLFMLLAKADGYDAWRAAMTALLLGLTLEIIEPGVLESMFEWWDIRDDAIGIAVALIGFESYWRAAGRNRDRSPGH